MTAMEEGTMQPIAQQIATLADARGLAGRERAVADLVCRMLQQSVPDTVCKDGTVIGHIGNDFTKPNLLLCAHLDQVGFLVTDITANGFLRIGAVGGIDRRLLLGQPVRVVGREQSFFGVISILPPHLLKGEQAVPTWETLCVDTGFASAEALEGKITRGDAVYFDTQCQMLQSNRMTGSALDNRCCVAAVLNAAARLSADEAKLPCRVTIVCSAQEERGSRGARLAAQSEQPDAAIAVDVTFAMGPGESPEGCMELETGPAIGVSSVLSESLTEALRATAIAQGIPYQMEVMPDSTGTDADVLALAPGGAQAATVSIPLRYMHTPVELIACEDVERTSDLLVAFARGYGAR